MAQDEALVGHTDTVDVHWAITAEVITLSSGVYQYQVWLIIRISKKYRNMSFLAILAVFF